ncbi:branched-chain amino acid ABC transporter permease [Hoeflea sp. YIM 152468]|uniref:branched-chain amino acid ABC transporter permease n=1 Tax=Hoeflea sp. YIM 152468 TaxID=3031759 RepID=UPI0023DA205C|nr:branched-chain amino acid ABC transporter permease [Hoeflea sp. YIM 152468]MDF1608641.1 branched-chain amino acid ABC transporter permease [Hoeflea sp. YIM 152468]
MRTPLILLLTAAIACALPAVLESGYFINVAIIALIYVILASSLDIMMGWTGKFSFAHAAFFGIGAYTAAMMQRSFGTDLWVHLPAGMASAALFGVLLGLPSLRLQGHFLAIMSIAFQTVVYLVLAQWTDVTGGHYGLSVEVSPELANVSTFYFVTLGCTLVACLFVWFLTHSRFGDTLTAIRDDETLARTIGMDTNIVKIIAFAISSALAGGAGVLMAHHIRGVTPNDYTVMTSATIVAMAVLGGRGKFWGPVVGALILTILPEVLSDLAEYKHIMYGALLIFMIMVMPQGVVGALAGRKAK